MADEAIYKHSDHPPAPTDPDEVLREEQKSPKNDSASFKEQTVYDIFVACASDSGNKPAEFVAALRENYPDLTVFFDEGLHKLDLARQRFIYEIVDQALSVVVFFSNEFIESPLCNEEFCIALARWNASDLRLFLPIHIDAIEMVPRRFTSIPFTDLTREGDEAVQKLACKLAEMVYVCKVDATFPDVYFFKQKLHECRAADFKKRFKLDGGHVVMNSSPVSLDSGEILFSCSPDCEKLATIMSVIVKQHAPYVTCHLQTTSNEFRSQLLMSADLVVFIISDQFISSPPHLEELHIVLNRQRQSRNSTISYFIQNDHESPKPFYLQALPFSVCVDDFLWKRLERASSNKNPRYWWSLKTYKTMTAQLCTLRLEALLDTSPLILQECNALSRQLQARRLLCAIQSKLDIDGVHKTFRCTAAQNLALTAAVHDMLHTMSQSGRKDLFNFLNVERMENELHGLMDEPVSVHEHIITLSSLNHLIKKVSPNPSPLVRVKPAFHFSQQHSAEEGNYGSYQNPVQSQPSDTARFSNSETGAKPRTQECEVEVHYADRGANNYDVGDVYYDARDTEPEPTSVISRTCQIV